MTPTMTSPAKSMRALKSMINDVKSTRGSALHRNRTLALHTLERYHHLHNSLDHLEAFARTKRTTASQATKNTGTQTDSNVTSPTSTFSSHSSSSLSPLDLQYEPKNKTFASPEKVSIDLPSEITDEERGLEDRKEWHSHRIIDEHTAYPFLDYEPKTELFKAWATVHGAQM